jgi:hypothetical protein
MPPAPPFGILGTIHPYYRRMIFAIYDEYGFGEFTCYDIQCILGMGDFECQKLRAWNNSKIVKNTKRKLEGVRQPVRVWRFTSAALNVLRNRNRQ